MKSRPTERPDRIVKLLCSYFYFADLDLDALVDAFAPHPVEIMADSGGFSAWSLGKNISLQEYIDWCHRWQHRLHAYAALDDLLSSQKTAENFAEMQRQGLSPLPIFHYGEDWRVLEDMIAEHAYIMLGGVVGTKERSWAKAMPWLIQCFKRAKGRAVYHGLGASGQKVLTSLPFYSADASTFVNAAKYGMIGLFDRGRNVWEFVRSNGENVSPHHLRLLRSYGISEKMLREELPEQHKEHINRPREDGALRGCSPFTRVVTSAAAAAWLHYEAYLRERHGRITIPGESEAPYGLRYYLVVNRIPVLQTSEDAYGLKMLLNQLLEAERDD